MPTLSPMDVLILHTVRHRDRSKGMADIALVLDIEEAHLATYAVRKLQSLGLVARGRSGKEKLPLVNPSEEYVHWDATPLRSVTWKVTPVSPGVAATVGP